MADLQPKHCHTSANCHHVVPVPPAKPQIIVPFQKAQEDFIEAFHVVDFGLIVLAAIVVIMGFKLHKLSMPKVSVSGVEAAVKSDASIALNWLKNLIISKWTLLLIIGGSLIGLAFVLDHLILSIGLGVIALVVGIKFGFDSLNPVTVVKTVATDLKNDATSAIADAEKSIQSMVSSAIPTTMAIPAGVVLPAGVTLPTGMTIQTTAAAPATSTASKA